MAAVAWESDRSSVEGVDAMLRTGALAEGVGVGPKAECCISMCCKRSIRMIGLCRTHRTEEELERLARVIAQFEGAIYRVVSEGELSKRQVRTLAKLWVDNEDVEFDPAVARMDRRRMARCKSLANYRLFGRTVTIFDGSLRTGSLSFVVGQGGEGAEKRVRKCLVLHFAPGGENVLQIRPRLMAELRLKKEARTSQAHAAFLREISLLARLHHPHIMSGPTKLYTRGDDPHKVSAICRYYPQSFEDLLLRYETRPSATLANRVVVIMTQVADALYYWTQQGVIHCDLKPGNVLYRVTRHVSSVVCDFGIYVEKVMTEDAYPELLSTIRSKYSRRIVMDSQLDQARVERGGYEPIDTDFMLYDLEVRTYLEEVKKALSELGRDGTRLYIPPERSRFFHTTRKTDVFAWGVMMQQFLAVTAGNHFLPVDATIELRRLANSATAVNLVDRATPLDLKTQMSQIQARINRPQSPESRPSVEHLIANAVPVPTLVKRRRSARHLLV